MKANKKLCTNAAKFTETDMVFYLVLGTKNVHVIINTTFVLMATIRNQIL